MHYNSGYDYFTPASADKIPHMLCKICGNNLDCQREQNHSGRRWPTPSITPQFRIVDIFTCKNSGYDWHDQIMALMRECEKTSSSKITGIIMSEIDEIRILKKVTKP
jgi:hypothetical protein